MTTHAASIRRLSRRGDAIGLAATALIWAAVTAGVGLTLREPAHVDRITIQNPLDWAVHVDVSDENGDGWVGLGRVQRGSDQTFRYVLDPGDTWIVRFTYAGQHAEAQLTRLQLEQDSWRVTVPDELATRLRAAGVPETPR
jgi:hypothetical protein